MTRFCIAKTAAGYIRGRRHGSGTWEFLGIPYAADTGGQNRFCPPRPAAPWRGIRDAFAFGPSCPQGDRAEDPNASVPLPYPQPGSSEDCLKLNVWTPAVDDGKRPVMIWLHGGGFAIGTASQSITNGGNLAAFGNAVVVSLNHRLNIFGFLFLDDIAEGSISGTCNLGLKDIVLALEWVRDHIEAFGGDPDNVTLFGVSGGGRKICCLMAMPSASGLFHRAIVQSGPHPRCIPRERATRFAAGFMDHLGLARRDISALRAISSEALLEQTVAYCAALRDPRIAADPVTAMWMMTPVTDGDTLPTDPWDPGASEHSRNIPLLIGTTQDEAAAHLSRRFDAGQMSRPILESWCRSVLGARGRKVLDAHAAARPDASDWDLMVGIAGEDRRLMSLDIAVKKSCQGGAPAYVYSFAWQTDVGWFGAAHGIDVPFVFRTVEQSPWTGTRRDRQDMSEILSAAWIAFARTGVPAVPHAPAWPPYDTKHRSTMILDVPSGLVNDPRQDERRAFGPTNHCMPWERESFAARLASPFDVQPEAPAATD